MVKQKIVGRVKPANQHSFWLSFLLLGFTDNHFSNHYVKISWRYLIFQNPLNNRIPVWIIRSPEQPKANGQRADKVIIKMPKSVLRDLTITRFFLHDRAFSVTQHLTSFSTLYLRYRTWLGIFILASLCGNYFSAQFCVKLFLSESEDTFPFKKNRSGWSKSQNTMKFYENVFSCSTSLLRNYYLNDFRRNRYKTLPSLAFQLQDVIYILSILFLEAWSHFVQRFSSVN